MHVRPATRATGGAGTTPRPSRGPGSRPANPQAIRRSRRL